MSKLIFDFLTGFNSCSRRKSCVIEKLTIKGDFSSTMPTLFDDV